MTPPPRREGGCWSIAVTQPESQRVGGSPHLYYQLQVVSSFSYLGLNVLIDKKSSVTMKMTSQMNHEVCQKK